MSTNRTVSSISPLLLRLATRSSRTSQSILNRRFPASAILIPYRASYSTEPSTSTTGDSNFPPPGFNAEQAKKPLRNDRAQGKQSSEADEAAQSATKLSEKDKPTASLAEEPSAQPPTLAQEKHAEQQLPKEKSLTSEKDGEKKVEEKKKEEKKVSMWQKFKNGMVHYWDGTKLLATEIKISSRLALKMAAGYDLTRRENRQLQRTVQDLGRLVPFSVFLIVPFAELLLPVALKLFPNLLPSTYEGQSSKDKKAKKLRATRKEVSQLLRQTLKETGLPVSAVNAQREEFVEFFRKLRTTGETPSASDVIKVCKIFKDDLTLDNLSRPQLVGICRYLNLNAFGMDAMLRYQVRHRMRQTKRDDKAIFLEGVESLSVPELQAACGSRGLRTYGVSPARLRDDLQMWLDLRLKYGVPSTLLVLSNAFVYAQGKDTELSSQIDALQAVLASVPDELFHEIELEVSNAEGAATNKQRLEVLKEQQELIEEENQQYQTSSESGQSAPKDTEDIDEKETTEKEQGEQSGQGEQKKA